MHRHILPLKNRLAGITRAVPSMPAEAAEYEDAPQPVGEPTVAPKESTDAKGLRDLLYSLSEIVAQAQRQRERTVIDLAELSVELGVVIAERLLNTAIGLDRQRLDQMVLTSLERMQTTRPVVVKAHPDDIVLLQQQMEGNASMERFRSALTFQPDADSPRGRLNLQSDELFVEWDTQRSLTELRALLLDEIFAENEM